MLTVAETQSAPAIERIGDPRHSLADLEHLQITEKTSVGQLPSTDYQVTGDQITSVID